MERTPRKRPKLVTALIETFGFSPWLASIVAVFLVMLGGAVVVWIWLSAPPRTVTLLTGPPGTSFDRYARFVEGSTRGTHTYDTRLKERDIALEVVSTEGSADNLKRLIASTSDNVAAFVQGGLVGEDPPPGIVSLGSVALQPLWVFYRGSTRMSLLSELSGKRIGIGEKGSATNNLARELLKRNDIQGPPTTLIEEAAEGQATALLNGQLDAVFLMGEAASTQTLGTLFRAPNVQLYHFTQADAYVRRIPFLNKIVVPQGAIDFGQNLPAQDVALVGRTVELLVREGINGALSDIVLDTASYVHGRPGLMARRNEFPAPLVGEYEISSDAQRYYKSGLGFTYKIVGNFWVASMINRMVVAIVPLVLLLIPAARLLPLAYRWSVQLRIYRHYRPLLRLEDELQPPLTGQRARELLEQLEEIDRDVNKLRVPASFAFQFYALREHVDFVRARLNAVAAA
jgi:TRAP-type uncharacterized transport system substrate-binding protein